MLFDERRRAELLQRYDALPDLERAVCRLLAVVYIPVASNPLAQCLNASALRTPRGVQWNAKVHVVPLLERWQRAGLVDVVLNRKRSTKIGRASCRERV